MSAISPCHLRYEVLRPSYVVLFETGPAGSYGQEAIGEQAFLGTGQHRHHPGRWGAQRAGGRAAPEQPQRPVPGIRCARPTPTPSRRCPPRNCCWSYDAGSSPPATHATTPGTTGTRAWARTATGPNRASSCPTLVRFAAPFAIGTEELMPQVCRNSPVNRAKWNR